MSCTELFALRDTKAGFLQTITAYFRRIADAASEATQNILQCLRL